MTARVNIADLPKHVRDQLQGGPERKRPRPSRATGGDNQPCAGYCGDCDDAFPTYGEWEKHSRQTGHGVWSIDLGRAR